MPVVVMENMLMNFIRQLIITAVKMLNKDG